MKFIHIGANRYSVCIKVQKHHVSDLVARLPTRTKQVESHHSHEWPIMSFKVAEGKTMQSSPAHEYDPENKSCGQQSIGLSATRTKHTRNKNDG